ncbi:hypothetical protein D3C78_1310550 [compost metagenome]
MLRQPGRGRDLGEDRLRLAAEERRLRCRAVPFGRLARLAGQGLAPRRCDAGRREALPLFEQHAVVGRPGIAAQFGGAADRVSDGGCGCFCLAGDVLGFDDFLSIGRFVELHDQKDERECASYRQQNQQDGLPVLGDQEEEPPDHHQQDRIESAGCPASGCRGEQRVPVQVHQVVVSFQEGVVAWVFVAHGVFPMTDADWLAAWKTSRGWRLPCPLRSAATALQGSA